MPYPAALFRIALALIMTLTLSHATVARSQGGTISRWVALCAGENVTSLPVDGEGRPVASHLPCPDCIVAGVALLAVAPAIPLPEQRAGGDLRPVAVLVSLPSVVVAPAARGPPVRV